MARMKEQGRSDRANSLVPHSTISLSDSSILTTIECHMEAASNGWWHAEELLMTSSSCEEGSDYEDDVLATVTTEQGSVLRSGSDVAADICAKLAAL